MKRWVWISLLSGSAAVIVGAFALGAKASDDLPPPPDPPPAPPSDGGVGTGSAYGVALAQWAAKQAAALPQYRRFFWSWRRLLETVEPPGGCVGPLNLVDEAQNVADTLAKSTESPDQDLYQLASWLYGVMQQMQTFKLTKIARFGTCAWGP